VGAVFGLVAAVGRRLLTWVAQVVADFTTKPPPSRGISRVFGSENRLGAM
jgi:hypothetical protein